MFEKPIRTVKSEIAVNILRMDGTTLECRLFVSHGQRMLDVLNDERTYIPYTDAAGAVTFIHKSTIAEITPVNQTNVKKTSMPKWGGKAAARR